MPKDELQKAIEDWTGHAEQKKVDKVVLIGVVLLLFACLGAMAAISISIYSWIK